MFFSQEYSEFKHAGQCRRSPPGSGTPHGVLYGLVQIHWVLSKGYSEFASKDDAVYFDPEYPDRNLLELGNFPEVADEHWCGEFKAEWP